MPNSGIFKGRLASAVTTFSLVFLSSCSGIQEKMYPVVNQKIYGPVIIKDEWLEIIPKEPLKATRDVSEVILWFADRYEPKLELKGVRSPDGRTITPEVQLVAQDGTTYQLTVSSLDETGIGFRLHSFNSTPMSLPKDKIYSRVRVRSNSALKCSSIIWRNYNPRDMK
jgi:hypothetical protein